MIVVVVIMKSDVKIIMQVSFEDLGGYFKVLSWHLCGRDEGNHRTLQNLSQKHHLS
jgi:hypothetical protein